MDKITQLKKLIEEAGLSDKVMDKIKEIVIRAELKMAQGILEDDCFTAEEKETLADLIKADMILDTLSIKANQAYLGEVDKILSGSKK